MRAQKKYAVLGNPIKHSLSPLIHQIFAEQTGIKLSYERIEVPEGEFTRVVQRLLSDGYCGFNITLPFKEIALSICHQLTERASQARAINTIYCSKTDGYMGDNTDGIGLLNDLQRLSFINRGDNILLIGAGGAARGIIAPLLAYGCKITLVNRTLSRAEKLVKEFASLGEINVGSYTNLSLNSVNLMINSTSLGMIGSPIILPRVDSMSTLKCYDLYYSPTLTPFLIWAKQQGCLEFADGLGMLVAQAAYSFELWNGIMPEITSTIKKLQHIIGHYESLIDTR